MQRCVRWVLLKPVPVGQDSAAVLMPAISRPVGFMDVETSRSELFSEAKHNALVVACAVKSSSTVENFKSPEIMSCEETGDIFFFI